MVDLLKQKLILLSINLSKNLELMKYLIKMKCVILLVLLKVKVMLVYKKDLV